MTRLSYLSICSSKKAGGTSEECFLGLCPDHDSQPRHNDSSQAFHIYANDIWNFPTTILVPSLLLHDAPGAVSVRLPVHKAASHQHWERSGTES